MIERDGATIILNGPCTVEDAETLLGHIHGGAGAIDARHCTLLHTACLQVLLAARLTLISPPDDPLLAQWVGPILSTTAPTEI